jgi:hypothetical protein
MANDYAERGEGWILFAGIMLLIAGVMNSIGGIAAIDEANFYTQNAHYVFSDLNTWGWIILVIGVIQLFAAFSIWSGGAYGRWVGIFSASANAIAQLFFISAFPLWSLAIFAIDVLIIYGLAAYGGRGLETGAGSSRTAG